MSRLNVLPDDIIKLIYKYINPIFDYVNYAKNIENYNDITDEILDILEDSVSIHTQGNIDERYQLDTALASISILQMEYLSNIKEFINNNPKFERPYQDDELTQFQYKKQLDTHINSHNMNRLHNNLKFHAGIWYSPHEEHEILAIHNIEVILREGTIQDLIFSCMVNNVDGFKTAFRLYMLREQSIDINIQKYKEVYISKFINHYYRRDTNPDTRNNTKKIPKRKTLVKRLMSI